MAMKFDPITGKAITGDSSEGGSPWFQAGNLDGTVSEEVVEVEIGTTPTEASSSGTLETPPVLDATSFAEEPEATSPPIRTEPRPVESTRPVQRFDPKTGRPIGEGAPGGARRFDPNTGRPIVEATPGGARRFDPNTGRPIGEGAPGGAKRFDPNTGRPINMDEPDSVIRSKKIRRKKSHFPAVAGVILGVAAIGGIAFAGMKSGILLSKPNKILLASYNTADALDGLSILDSKSYTIGFNGKDGESTIDMKLMKSKSEGQITGSFSSEYIPNISYQMGITEDEVCFKIPSVDDRIVVYNYSGTDTDALSDLLGTDEVEQVNETLKVYYNSLFGSGREGFVKAMESAVLDEYRSLNFANTSPEKFEIAGKSVECKGYEFTITGQNYINVLDKIQAAYYKYYNISNDSTLGQSATEAFDVYKTQLGGMPNTVVKCFLYKNKLACINFEMQGDTMQILFKGKDSGIQNVEFVSNDENMGSVSYDTKTGDFSVSVTNGYDDVYINGNYQKTKNSIDLKVDNCSGFDGSSSLSGEISISKGADIQKLSGTEFDIKTATGTELEELLDKFGDL